MKQEELTIDNKIDILKHIDSIQRDEVMFRREREYKIFTWSGVQRQL